MANMTEHEIDRIYRLSNEKIAEVSMERKRYCYDSIHWQDRLISIKGPRGVGKTTLLLQKIAESGGERRDTLYVSLDSIWLEPKDVYELAEHHVQHGGRRLVLDEVHYMQDWSRLIKNLYDDFKTLSIAYTGSSMLKLRAKDGDLSRRQSEHVIPGLSFREFLDFEGVLSHAPLTLDEILNNHVDIVEDIRTMVRILPLWEWYFRRGYYPFYLEGESQYENRIRLAVNQTLDVDWPSVEEITAPTIRRARKMMRILADMPPQTPKMKALYAELETERQHGLKMLYALERARLLTLLPSEHESLDDLRSPEKIYLDNPNMMYALVADANVGTARECFFANQVGESHLLAYPKRGDFLVDDTYLFEVGGKGKTFDQIKDVPNSYVVNDGVEFTRGNKIPLWLFGFLY